MVEFRFIILTQIFKNTTLLKLKLTRIEAGQCIMPGYANNNNNTGLLYNAFFLLLAQSALHSITPARIASLGNLTYCCHARYRSQYPLKLGTHISSGWREAQTRLTSCPRMLSHMKQLASLGIEPTTLGL